MMIFGTRYMFLAISCDIVFSSPSGHFTPELGMLMAESFSRGRGAETLSYASKRFLAGGTFSVNGSADRLTAEPVDFSNRLQTMLDFFTGNDLYDFGLVIDKFNTTCIDATNITAHYEVSEHATLAIAQAGVLSAIMSMRANDCGYTSAQLISYATSQIQNDITEIETNIAGADLPDDTFLCYLERLRDAIRRLKESTDPLAMGFLTMDTCIAGLSTPHVLPSAVYVAVSAPGSYYDPGMIDVAYPSRDYYQTGNFSRRAWFIDPPADAAFASVWFNIIKATRSARSRWELFSIQDRFTVSLKRNLGRDQLIISEGCRGRDLSYVDIRYTPGWHFVSVSLRDDVAVIRYDDRSWQVEAPLRAQCGLSATLGPRLDAPWDLGHAENSVIRFFDFKVASESQTEDVHIIRAHLIELGTDIPVICNTKSGNERREGLKACYPGPVVRVQYIYDTKSEDGQVAEVLETASPSSDETNNPLHVEESVFGQREYLIITALGLVASLLTTIVYTCYISRWFTRQIAEFSVLTSQARASGDVI
jgi:hypothetical protein